MTRDSDSHSGRVADFDVVVYGGSSAGVTAAVQARRMGKTAVIVDPYGFLGGMTASGLSHADVYEPRAISGLAREFFVEMGVRYGPDPYTRSFYAERGSEPPAFSREFEPAVAEAFFTRLAAEADVSVVHGERLDLSRDAVLTDGRLGALPLESGRDVSGRMFIDATYEGDLMAVAGVSYVVGREANSAYGESLNGFQLPDEDDRELISDFGTFNFFSADVDPYVVRGAAASGLLPRITPHRASNGDPDPSVQAYNYRVVLTNDPGNRIPFERPDGYRHWDHELLLRNFEAGDDRVPGTFAQVPGNKVDFNNFGPVSTNLAMGSAGYPEADHDTRRVIDAEHETYTRGLLWTLAHHQRVPVSVRNVMREWGYPRDEFQRNSGFPYMLYVREARRMVSDVVMTEHHCRHRAVVDDPVALASFPMDSHPARYAVNERGCVETEGWVYKLCDAPFGISYRSIVPRLGESANLLVPVCLSASHVAHGAIRMEPEFMSLGQAAGAAASLALDHGVAVQLVPYRELRERLVADDMVVEWTM